MTKIEIAVCEVCGEPMPEGEGMFKFHGYSGNCPPTIINEFKGCLSTMSYSRAGWDYELPKEQRAKEDGQAKEALAKAKWIWAVNPNLHERLRKAFSEASPLATMNEIEAA